MLVLSARDRLAVGLYNPLLGFFCFGTLRDGVQDDYDCGVIASKVGKERLIQW